MMSFFYTLTSKFGLQKENVSQFIKDLITFSFSEGTTQASALIISVLLARKLGPEEYGGYAVALSIATIVTFISTFGLNTLIVKEVATQKGSINVASFFLVKALFSLINVLVIFTLYLMSSGENGILFVLAAFHLLFEGWGISLLMFLRGQKDFFHESLLKTVYRLLNLGLLAGILVTNVENLSFVFFALLTMSAILFAVIAWLAMFRYVDVTMRFGDHILKDVVMITRGALLMGMASFMWLVYYKLDVFILGAIGNTSAAGIYSVAYSVVKFGSLGLTLISSVLFPSLTAVILKGAFVHTLRTYARIMSVAGFLLAIITAVFSPLLITTMYGTEYSKSVLPAVLLSFVFIATFPSNLWINTLIALDKLKTLFILTTAAAILSVLCNVLLIPRFSYFGPVYTTLITEFFVLVASYVLVRRVVSVATVTDVQHG